MSSRSAIPAVSSPARMRRLTDTEGFVLGGFFGVDLVLAEQTLLIAQDDGTGRNTTD